MLQVPGDVARAAYLHAAGRDEGLSGAYRLQVHVRLYGAAGIHLSRAARVRAVTEK